MSPQKKYTLLILCAVVIIAAFFFLFRKPEIQIPQIKNTTVVAFGDSLVVGVGASGGNDFVSRVGNELGISIINKGKSGDTTESALLRVDEVVALDPGVVILLLGGNDYLQRVSKETTFKNLQTIVQKFKTNGTAVVLLGVRGGVLRDTYESDFRAFADKEGLMYVPNVLDGILGSRELMSDQIHPNDLGYAKIAARVAPILKRILDK